MVSFYFVTNYFALVLMCFFFLLLLFFLGGGGERDSVPAMLRVDNCTLFRTCIALSLLLDICVAL